MYVAIVPNRSSSPAVLLQESYRDDDKVKFRTIANLTHWPASKVERGRDKIGLRIGQVLGRRKMG